MTRRQRGALLIQIAFLLCMCSAHAATRVIATTDRIPLGNWSYDAMISLAADGLVPGYAARVFEGDRLFDRLQMAEAVAVAIDASKSRMLRPSQMALINHLVQDFKPELDRVASGVAESWMEKAAKDQPGGVTFALGYLRAPNQDSTTTESNDQIPHRLSIYSNLSDKAFGMVTAADSEDKFFEQLRHGPTPDKVILQGYDSNFMWSLGRQYQSWGPGYSGSLILSDNSIGFWQGLAAGEADFGKLLGRFKITEFASAFEDDKMLYFFGRRFEKPLSTRWNLGISETALMNKAPNPSILVLPFYLYQHVFGGPGSTTDKSMNTLYATDLTYLSKGGPQYYGELLIDDITAPRMFSVNHFERPRKIGYTLGVYLPKFLPSTVLSTIRAEYIFVDQQTYSATRPEFPELAYIHNGAIIGNPIGPNANALYLRAEHYVTKKWSLIGEYFNQRQSKPGAPIPPQVTTVSLMPAYDITPNKSLALRIAPFRITRPGQPVESGTEYDLSASFAF